MSNTIGEVNVNLRMSLVQFKDDVQRGTKTAKDATKELADSVNVNMREARGSMMLLGDEIGFRIPRHLQYFIATLPGVGSALNAAFNSVAVLALISLVVEAGKKMYEFSNAAQKAYEKIRDESAKTIERVRQDTHQLELSMMSPLQRLVTETQDAQGELDKVNDKIAELQKKQAELKGPGAVSRGVMLAEGAPQLKALEAQLAKAYEDQQHYQTKVEKLKKDAADIEKKLAEDVTKKHQSELDKRLAAEKQYGDLMLKQRQLAAKAPDGMITRTDIIPGDVTAGMPDIMKGSKPGEPVYSGTKEAMEAAKIQTDQNAAIAEAQRVYTQTRTAAEQYKQELAVLDELLKQGRIDQDTYNRAVDEAKERMDGTHKALQQFGQDVGDTIAAAALMGRSWSDAFKSILVQLVQVIMQMTVLKKLQDSMSGGSGGGGGFGGFLGSLLGGLFGGHKAEGGPLEPGKWYIAGEYGPEPVWGGGAGAFAAGYGRGGNTFNYFVDARGAYPGAADDIKRALKETENRAVAKAVATMEDRRLRR